MKAVIWETEALGANFHDEEIPEDLRERAESARLELIEASVELDDDAMSAYLDGTEPDEATLKRLIRKAVLISAYFPVLAGSAFKNKGVQTLLDAVVDYLPSPIDVPPTKGIDVKTGEEITRPSSDSEPLAMLAFKIIEDPFGILTFARVYSGRVAKGTALLNSTKDKKERVGRMVLMHADSREDIDEAFAGDIVALVGLKDTRTGDTLCDPLKPVIWRRWSSRPGHRDGGRGFLQARSGKARRRATEACRRGPFLQRLHRSGVGSDDHQGDGRASPRHQDRYPAPCSLQHQRDGGCTAGCLPRDDPQGDGDRLHPQEADRWHGPVRARQVRHRAERSRFGFLVREQDHRRRRAEGIHPGVEKGLNSVMTSGPLAGFPVVDVKVQLIDGAYHEVDSSAIAFEIASRAAFREGLQRANPALLEPIMKVECVSPEEYVGSVIGDLNSRRGQIQGQDMRGNANVITAFVPLANMFGYVNTLRSMSQGRASYTMLFDHYEQVPNQVAQEIQAKYA
jgi:elongation factor G